MRKLDKYIFEAEYLDITGETIKEPFSIMAPGIVEAWSAERKHRNSVIAPSLGLPASAIKTTLLECIYEDSFDGEKFTVVLKYTGDGPENDKVIIKKWPGLLFRTVNEACRFILAMHGDGGFYVSIEPESNQ